MILWIIGAGGLFGSAFCRVMDAHSYSTIASRRIPWLDAGATVRAIETDAIRLRSAIESAPVTAQKWGITWAAGRATTASTEADTALELESFKNCLRAIRHVMEGVPNGVFAVASSAGGVYAGSENAPFSSSSEVKPLSAYGKLKLGQEQAAAELLGDFMGVVIARVSNLYGPGQDLTKLQGLVSRLALSSITKEPLTMFVSLDTLRDHITTDDAAERILHWISTNDGTIDTRVIASGQTTSLGFLINLVKNIARVPTPIASGMHSSSAYQSMDLRLLPDSDDAIQSLPLTPLPAGIKRVYEDVLARHQAGETSTGRIKK